MPSPLIETDVALGGVNDDGVQVWPPLVLYNIPEGDPAIAFKPSLLIEVDEYEPVVILECAQNCPPFILYHKPEPTIPAIALVPSLLEEREKIRPVVTLTPPVDCDQFIPPFVLYHIPVDNEPPAIAFIQSSPEERQIKLLVLLLDWDWFQELKLNKQGFVG